MIKYEWRTGLDAAEAGQLADLLARAAEYDAEPEYNTLAFADIEQSMATSDERARHLVIWMLPYSTALGEMDRPERIAGIIRLVADADGQTAEATIVIDPPLRSIGITTLLLERMGVDRHGPSGPWGGEYEVITAWARGNHPAATRLSNRFLIPSTRRVWKLICPVDPGDDVVTEVLELVDNPCGAALPEWVTASIAGPVMTLRDDGRLVATAQIDPRPVTSEEFGRCATLTSVSLDAGTTDPVASRRRLLRGAAAAARGAGFAGLVFHVDADDAKWVNACRSVGFQH
ncbi:MAG: hypothetical protein PGN37_12415, partial [Mycobacterium kyogaense]|uniref:hypothetical protein n=1 Tax=Mycobacterium kyogaense TaxID=2212479 RepID=UPI002FFAD01C